MRVWKCMAAAILLCLAFLCVPVSADGLTIITDKRLPAAEANVPYGPVQLQVTGGTPPYTFKLRSSSASLPAGLTFDAATGTFSGTPAVGMFYGGIRVRVTDAAGAWVEKRFSINIDAIMVEYRISGETTAGFDGQPHGFAPEDIKAYVNGVERNDISYYVQYGSQTTRPVAAGSYSVRVITTTPGYLTGSVNVSQYRIERLTAQVAFSNLSHTYDGQPKYAAVSVTDGVAHTVTYTTLAGVAVTAPTEPGQYRVTCNITDPNYNPPRVNNAIMTISPQQVSLTWPGGDVEYDGSPHPVSLTPGTAEVPYTVAYEKDGVTVAQPVEIGQYRIVVTITDPRYQLVDVQPPILNILRPTYPVKVQMEQPSMGNITINGENVHEKRLYDGEEVTVTIAPAGERVRLVGWTVAPDALERQEDESTVSFVMPAEPVTITVTFEADYHLSLLPGNSIAARLDEAGLQQFLTDRRYQDGVYGTNAWMEGSDCDADPAALFMRVGQTITLPGAEGVNSAGEDVTAFTLTLDNPYGTGENVPLTIGGQFTADKRVKPGIYRIIYAFDDAGLGGSITTDRPLVVVGSMGDANGDGILNSIDGNCMADAARAIPEQTALQKLLKYRMCDINRDGVVNSLDAQAVYNRIKTPLPLCYPFLGE